MRLNTKAIDIEKASYYLSYDEETGHLIWNNLQEQRAYGPKHIKNWNSRMGGKRAGKLTRGGNAKGYRVVALMGKEYQAHRLAWAIKTRCQPPYSIDHINGDTDDNRWCNLRSGVKGENARNRVLQSNNTSGVCGVTWISKLGRWQAYITENGNSHYLGVFENLEDAKIARKQAEKKFGFSERHGECR